MFVDEYLYKNKNSNKTALICGDNKITYHVLFDTCMKIGTLLSSDEKNIGIYINNSIEYVISYFSILQQAKTAVLMNTMLKSNELKNIIQKCEIKTIFTVRRFKGIFSGMDLCEQVIYVDEIDIKNLSAMRRLNYRNDNNSDNECALIIPTSGTTESAKYVALSHANLHANVEGILECIEIADNGVELVVLPLSSAYSNTGQLLPCIYRGITIVLNEGPISPNKIFDLIKEYKVNYCELVPSILRLMNDCYDKNKHDISSLVRMSIGGEHMPVYELKEIKKNMQGFCLLQGYGLTEASPIVTSLVIEDCDSKEDSSGRPFYNVELKIIDEKGKEVPAGNIGEIIIKGKTVMLGYYKYSGANVIQNGWLHTGDCGYLDPDGYLYLTGRKKNIIISGGQNIYPEEIESILRENYLIEQVLVEGEPHEVLGEVAVAKIVLANNDERNIEEIIEFCKKKMASYKIPKRFDICMDLEKTATNKILRRSKHGTSNYKNNM